MACHHLFTMLIFLDRAPSGCVGNSHVHDQDYHNTCTFFNNIYYNIRAYTISFKEIPASPCRNLKTLLNQRMEYSHGHKLNNKHVKKHNLHQDRSIRDFIGHSQWPYQRTLFSIQHSVGHWYKTCEHARTNTTRLLQIAATDEFRYRNETGLA